MASVEDGLLCSRHPSRESVWPFSGHAFMTKNLMAGGSGADTR